MKDQLSVVLMCIFYLVFYNDHRLWIIGSIIKQKCHPIGW